MKVIDLLNKIANEGMEEAIFYVNGDFFYDLIVIDKNLYVINTIAKKLEPLENKYISRFIKDNVELIRLDKFEEILEEEKKIPERVPNAEIFEVPKLNNMELSNIALTNKEDIKIIKDILNKVLDYLKSKGDE